MLNTPWSDLELAILQNNATKTSTDLMALLPGRSKKSIQLKRQRSTKPEPALKVEVATDAMPSSKVVRPDGSMDLNMMVGKDVKTLEDLFEVCQVDREQWSVVSWSCKAWMMGAKTGPKDGPLTLETIQLYSVTAKLQPKRLSQSFRDESESILAEIRAMAHTPAPVLRVSKPTSGKMLELSIPDAHLGKLAWWRECGQSYDVRIAREIFMDAVEDLLGKVQPYSFDCVALVVGNDFLNADNFENTTARGTPQSTDGRQQKTFWVARELITAVVQRLRTVAPEVRVVMVAGNHDLNTNFYLGEVLDAYFHAYDDVKVDNRPTQRKYMEWGQVLLGWTHGSEEKQTSLPMIMAQEQKQAWGRTSYREWHLGHLHKRKAMSWVGVDEDLGVTVRILPSLCAAEDWHTSKGYVGNTRSAEAYVWDKETGLCGTAVYTVPNYSDTWPMDKEKVAA